MESSLARDGHERDAAQRPVARGLVATRGQEQSVDELPGPEKREPVPASPWRYPRGPYYGKPRARDAHPLRAVKTSPQLNFAPTSVYFGCKSCFILNFYQEHFGDRKHNKKGS